MVKVVFFWCSAIWRVDPYNLMPPKRKDRPTSSSSDAVSPEVKKTREAKKLPKRSEFAPAHKISSLVYERLFMLVLYRLCLVCSVL